MKISTIIAATIAALLLCSCAVQRYQPVQRDSTVTVRVDSVVRIDSVYIDRIRTIEAKADTVYVTDIKTEYKFKYLDRVKIDTLIVERERIETVEVEKPLTWWQTFRLRAFWVLAAAAALWIVLKFRR